MTPFDSKAFSYNRLGIALKNDKDIIGKKMFEKDDDIFNNFKYIIIAILLLGFICLFAIIYYFCRLSNSNDEDMSLNTNRAQKRS